MADSTNDQQYPSIQIMFTTTASLVYITHETRARVKFDKEGAVSFMDISYARELFRLNLPTEGFIHKVMLSWSFEPYGIPYRSLFFVKDDLDADVVLGRDEASRLATARYDFGVPDSNPSFAHVLPQVPNLGRGH